MDAYGILGLKRGVSQEEVKKAYRRASLKYHPDRNHGNEAAERLFRLIKSAYESLCIMATIIMLVATTLNKIMITSHPGKRL